MTGYALDLKVKNSITDSEFRVTPAMRAELLRRLREKGVNVSDSLWAGVRKLIDEQFSYEVAHYVFGKEVEFRRRVADDAQVREAISLLQRARTPSDLIALAPSSTAQRQ
jgi:hypothetical protein